MGVRLTSQFNDDHGIRWKVDIHDEDYSLSATDFTLGGDGFQLNWDGRADNTHTPIMGSTLEFTFYEESNTHEQALNLLATSEEGRWLVEVTRDLGGSDEQVYWRGVILPELVERQDVGFPRPTTITATCDLGNLKHVDFNDDGVAYTGSQTLVQMIVNCLSKCRTTTLFGSNVGDAFVHIGRGFYASNATNAAMGSQRVAVSAFQNIGSDGQAKFYPTYEVLKSICITYNARLFHADGVWWFLPINQYQDSGNALVTDIYRKTGAVTVGVTSPSDVRINEGSTFKRLAGGVQTHLPALKKVKRTVDTHGIGAIIRIPEILPADMGTLVTDDSRVYTQGQKFHVGGKFVWSWPERHSGSVPADYMDRFARFEISIVVRIGGVAGRYANRQLTYDEVNVYESWNGTSISNTVAEHGPIEWDSVGSVKFCLAIVEEGIGWNIYDDVGGDFVQPFDFLIPGLDVTSTGMAFTMDVRAVDHEGNTYTDALDGDGTTAPTYKFVDARIFYSMDQVPSRATYEAVSDQNSRHELNQGQVLIGDTITNTGLGEIEVFTGGAWAEPTGWTIDNMESDVQASGSYIHGLGTDEVLRCRISPLKVWQFSHRSSVEVYPWNVIYFDSGSWLMLNMSFTAQSGNVQSEVWQVQRDSTADSTTEVDPDIDFDQDPRGPNIIGGPGGKPVSTVEAFWNDTKRGLSNTNSDLSDVQADVADNTTAIGTLDGSVSTNTANITTNQSNINTVDGNLTTLQKKIEGENLDKLGVFSNISDDTQGSVKITTTSAILRAGSNTAIEASQTSPGSMSFKVQAGASGSEAEVTALTITGSSTVNTKATTDISGGDLRINATTQFNSGSTVAFQDTATFNGSTSGIDYGDLDNTPTIPSDLTDLDDTPGSLGTAGQVLAVNSGATALEFVDQSGGGSDNSLSEVDQTLGADRTVDGGGSYDLIIKNPTDFKVTNSANATVFSVVPGSPGTVQVNGNFSVDSAQVTGGSIRLEEANLLGSNYIELKAPISITSNVTLTFPDGAGSNGQVLQSNGSGTLSWTDKLGDTNPLVKGVLTIERVTAGNVPRLYIKGEDNLAGVFLKAPEAISTDVTFQLPESDGSTGDVLKTDGSGNLSFTESPVILGNISGRYTWSSADDGERVHTGNFSYGPFNWYSFTSEPSNATFRTYSAGDTVGSTSYSLAGSHLLAYGFQIPTTTKKVRIRYIFRLQNAPAASTWGISLWGADLPTSGSTSSSTTTLRAETADITQSSNSSARIFHGTLDTGSAFDEDMALILVENRSGALASTTYMYAQFQIELID